jgi:RNA polymerase sigma factor (sigma-70 family)
MLSEITQIVRRVTASRIPDRDTADEIVQETIARLLASRDRLDDAAALPYAIVIARNLIASHWRSNEVDQRNQHRLLDRGESEQPDDGVVEQAESEAIRAALERLSPRERDVLVAHEVRGEDLSSLADDLGSTPRAVAAQLHRSRAKLRVEYLLEMYGQPPSAACHSVLVSLSAGDKRRQAELDAGYHLLDCDFCALLSEPIFDRRAKTNPDEASIPIRADADIVAARQLGREMAVRTGFTAAEATVIATAISEITRNIVRFARRGEVTITRVSDDGTPGVMIVARDAGPGIADLDLAMTVGYTTYGGQGLGLPGSRRLMDQFEISTELGRGTTVTMTKWSRSR